MNKYNSAVIGLGNIGFQFNLDPLRKDIWSHVSAYEACENTVLTAAIELDQEKIDIFKQHHSNIPVYQSIDDLMKNFQIDLVSVCTPTKTHYSIIKELVNYPVKAIVCEKPLYEDIDESLEMVRLCKEKNIKLIVNHIRRWDSHYLYVKKLIDNGKIGEIRAVNSIYPGQIFNIGSHLIDTIRMYINLNPKSVSAVSFDLNNPDPYISGWINFNNLLPCNITASGKREDLIFEIDIIGSEGRIKILENGSKIELFEFKDSKRYSGYRELIPIEIDKIELNERFVEVIKDSIEVIEGKKEEGNCSGMDAYYSLAMSSAMLKSAKENGKVINFNDEGKMDV